MTEFSTTLYLELMFKYQKRTFLLLKHCSLLLTKTLSEPDHLLALKSLKLEAEDVTCYNVKYLDYSNCEID